MPSYFKRKFERPFRNWSRPVRRRLTRSAAGKMARGFGRLIRKAPKFGALGAMASMWKDVPWNQGALISARKRQEKRRMAGSGPVPKTPGSRVSAKYAVASKMTKFKKEKLSKVKQPKSAIVHYKEFGQFNAEKCMYINHEHWGHIDRLWKGIAYGLTKLVLAKAKIYNAKSLEDPCIGPRTNNLDIAQEYDNKSSAMLLRLGFYTEGPDGAGSKSVVDINIDDISANPDKYRSFDAIATDVATELKAKYNFGTKTWLQDAAVIIPVSNFGTHTYIQNLDDAEVHLYVNSLIKLQNVTTSDAGALDKNSVDANPLVGRIFTGKAHKPEIDSDLLQSGDKTLDTFFW